MPAATWSVSICFTVTCFLQVLRTPQGEGDE
jgi:hypothetical protein